MDKHIVHNFGKCSDFVVCSDRAQYELGICAAALSEDRATILFLRSNGKKLETKGSKEKFDKIKAMIEDESIIEIMREEKQNG
jgi:predicted peroxiredoxin